jgi:transcriptional pleiotropic repressor
VASVLLEKTRQISRLLEKVEKIAYADLSNTLSDVMRANVYIVNREGIILGYTIVDNFECDLMMEKVLKFGRFPERYVNWLSKVLETSENLTLKNGMCAFSPDTSCIFNEKFTTVIPIYGAGERLGTLIVATFKEPFVDDDLILAEYAATVVGIEFLRDRTERIEDDARKMATIQVALGTLSYSEMEAVMHILGELDGNEGLLVASKIADRVGITRSVIVNALRKFESAGVIESKSLGMKGTYIKVLNEKLIGELKRLKK